MEVSVLLSAAGILPRSILAHAREVLWFAWRPCWVSALLLIATPGSTEPVAYPRSLWRNFTSTYAIISHGITVGQMTREFSWSSETNYALTIKIQPRGLARLITKTTIEERSEGKLDQGRLRSYRYMRRKHRGKKVTESHATFDPRTKLFSGLHRGRQWSLAAPAETHDPISYQLALVTDLARDAPLISYDVIDKGTVKRYDLELLGNAVIEVPAGTFDTIKLRYQRSGSKRKTLIWCAPALDHLPARIEYTEKNGDVTRADLREITFK